MFGTARAFSGFSVDDLAEARRFYGETLGLQTSVEDEGADGGMQVLFLTLAGGARVFVYPKGDRHIPASFTILNFVVDDVDAAVDELRAKGVETLRYPEFDQDEKGIARQAGGGPSVAWFADPAKNVLAVLQR
ncbi:VOC family protein [Streptomyces sp. NPDC058740]|uniref:VOC family protein n=1 Tax=unclassified Streptomyces TaxID=2593676 RepID=UPI0036A729D4